MSKDKIVILDVKCINNDYIAVKYYDNDVFNKAEFFMTNGVLCIESYDKENKISKEKADLILSMVMNQFTIFRLMLGTTACEIGE